MRYQTKKVVKSIDFDKKMQRAKENTKYSSANLIN